MFDKTAQMMAARGSRLELRMRTRMPLVGLLE
jgi:hypothetical protein